MKAVNESDMPEIEEVLETLARKRERSMPSLTKLQGSNCHGDYSLLGIKDLVDKTASPKNRLVPLRDRMGRRLLRQWEFIYRLYRLSAANSSGIYGVVVIQGEPAAGKSTLGLQIGVSISVERAGTIL